MKYHVVFDVLKLGYQNWWFPALGLFFLAVVAMFVDSNRKGLTQVGRLRLVSVTAFSLLWIGLSFGSTFTEYIKLRDALRNGKYVVVEGRVSQFIPMRPDGPRHESFVVSGRYYSYSDGSVMTGFHQPQRYGGPIHEGLQVRIADVDGQIARLEVAEYVTAATSLTCNEASLRQSLILPLRLQLAKSHPFVDDYYETAFQSICMESQKPFKRGDLP